MLPVSLGRKKRNRRPETCTQETRSPCGVFRLVLLGLARRFLSGRLPTNKWFARYARAFKTVELNAPFYSWPMVGTVQGWKRQIGKSRFVYTVKASELITHVKQFSGTKTLVRDFGHVADLLDASMGCLLFQLPPSFHYSAARLYRIVAQLDPPPPERR